MIGRNASTVHRIFNGCAHSKLRRKDTGAVRRTIEECLLRVNSLRDLFTTFRSVKSRICLWAHDEEFAGDVVKGVTFNFA